MKRPSVFLAASLLTGGAVALAGPIGFVGIVVPHALRLLVGSDHRALLLASALGGAIFLVLADTVTRLSFLALGIEPTVGVVTAFIGAPFFLLLLRQRGVAAPVRSHETERTSVLDTSQLPAQVVDQAPALAVGDPLAEIVQA